MRTIYFMLIIVVLMFGMGTSVLAAIPNAVTAEHDAIIPLGEAKDISGKKVEGFKIIHYKKDHAKPPTSQARPRESSVCYGFIAKGAKWKVVEPWVINASNPNGLSETGVVSVVQNGVNKWEDAADGVVGSGASKNILGNGSTTLTPLVADEVQPDGQNEVYFGAVDQGAIAVTIVWGIFGGPISQRQLVEWDQIYGSNYTWSLTGEANKMDFDNIATHELGHSTGLADLYKVDCSQQTMYGYANYGETNKRTLEAGDIDGVKTLYQ